MFETPPSFRMLVAACSSVAAAVLAFGSLLASINPAQFAGGFPGGGAPLDPDAAVAILSAVAAWFLLNEGRRVAGSVCAVLTGLIAVINLSGHITGVGADIDLTSLLTPDRPDRLASAACISLLFGAFALLLTPWRSSWVEDVRQFARLAGLALPVFALALFFYDRNALAAIRGFEGVSLYAWVTLTLLFVGIGFGRQVGSLRWQIAYVGVAVIAPLAALTLHFAGSERDRALARAGEQLESSARLAADRQESVIEQTRQMLQVVARSSAARNPGPVCMTELSDYLPLVPGVRSIFTVRPDGTIRCGTRPDLATVSLSDRDYVRQVFETGRYAVSSFFLSRPSGQPRIAVAVPAQDQNLIVAASLDLSSLGDELKRVASGGVTTVVDRYGVVIARWPAAPALIGQNLSSTDFVAHALAAPEQPFVAKELDGRETVFAARRAMMGGITLVLGLPRDEVVGPVDQALNARLITIALILATSLALGVVGSEILVLRPLRRLISYAGRLEAGDFAATPSIGSRGEVRALARALAVSAKAIEERERRLAAAEALFRRIFDDSPDIKIVLRVRADSECLIERWNEAAARSSGLFGEAIVGRRLSAVFDSEAIENDLRLVVERGKAIKAEREPLIDGEPTAFEMQIMPLFSAAGEVERIFLSARDISDRKRVERLKNEFVSTVSHELRTPLTSIAGSLGLLAGGAAGGISDKAMSLIAIAHSNSLRLVRLINDILDIEKIEAGRMTFDVHTLEVVDLVEQAAAELKGFAEEYGVAIDIRPEGEDLTVRGDADRLTQVITNLLSNAIKFSPRGGAVTVSLTAEGDIVTLTVRDRGPGVPDAFRPRIFTKFAQADGSDSRRKGGTGLGLAIVREIVERHAGAVSYTSPEDGGAAFIVRLPRHIEQRRVAAAGAHEAVRPPKVLICEDDMLIATILAEQMRDAGFEALVVGTKREALQAVMTDQIDAMLSDLRLPDGDGVSLIRSLRATVEGRRIPIVVVSADARSRAADPQTQALDVAAWLEKPVDTRRIAALLRTHLKPGGARPRILHVEDDADLCEVISAALGHMADVRSASGLMAARQALREEIFDLAIIDVTLDDGSGLDLLDSLASTASGPVPAVIFSARDVSREDAQRVKAAITKSRTSLGVLVETVRRLMTPPAPSAASIDRGKTKAASGE